MLQLQLIALALAVVLPSPGTDLARTGTLRATFLATNPVQGRVDPQTGAVTGPAADLVRELARRLGVPFTILPVPDAAAVIDSLKNRETQVRMSNLLDAIKLYDLLRKDAIDTLEDRARLLDIIADQVDEIFATAYKFHVGQVARDTKTGKAAL